jgi:hypothetical protein
VVLGRGLLLPKSEETIQELILTNTALREYRLGTLEMLKRNVGNPLQFSQLQLRCEALEQSIQAQIHTLREGEKKSGDSGQRAGSDNG